MTRKKVHITKGGHNHNKFLHKAIIGLRYLKPGLELLGIEPPIIIFYSTIDQYVTTTIFVHQCIVVINIFFQIMVSIYDIIKGH